jgi:hypothetical protein
MKIWRKTHSVANEQTHMFALFQDQELWKLSYDKLYHKGKNIDQKSITQKSVSKWLYAGILLDHNETVKIQSNIVTCLVFQPIIKASVKKICIAKRK